MALDLASIPGATPLEICAELRRYATLVPQHQAIVEVGVYLGRSVCFLGQGSLEGQRARVWGIDPWDLPGDRRTYAESKAGVSSGPSGFTDPATRAAAERHVKEAGLEDIVTLVRGFAADIARVWSGPRVGLMYIDGDHHADTILADFAAWRPHLSADAILLFDDHQEPFDEVIAAVDVLRSQGDLAEVDVLHARLAVARLGR